MEPLQGIKEFNQINTTFSLSPYGLCQVEEVLHEGELFSTYKCLVANQRVCVKAPTPNLGQSFSSEFSGIETSLWCGVTKRQQVDRTEAALLLSLEVETVRHTDGHWNHKAFGLACMDGYSPLLKHPNSRPNGLDENPEEPRFWPAAVFEHHDATPLGKLPPAVQAEVFPKIVRSLWRALSQQAHGDLSTSNILVDVAGGRFSLIDPGVFMQSKSYSTESYANDRSLFTTNERNYPILFPHGEVDGLTNWMGTWGGGQSLMISNPVFRRWAGNLYEPYSNLRPSPADQQALGLMYFRILTGEELFPVLELLGEPVWCGWYGEGHVPPPSYLEVVCSTLNDTFLMRRLNGLSAQESSLIHRLVTLNVKGEQDLAKLSVILPD